MTWPSVKHDPADRLRNPSELGSGLILGQVHQALGQAAKGLLGVRLEVAEEFLDAEFTGGPPAIRM
jgi:hypothetical protein